jgi:hypothetical protein
MSGGTKDRDSLEAVVSPALFLFFSLSLSHFRFDSSLTEEQFDRKLLLLFNLLELHCNQAQTPPSRVSKVREKVTRM